MFLYGIQIFNRGEVIRKHFPLRHRGQETTLGCQGRNIMKEMELVEMRYFEERPFSEISEITGLSVINIKVSLHRIIQKLKVEYKKVSL